MNKDIIISPIFYMGNKKKLISQGLTKLFPKHIKTFVDLFAGSSIVAMNTTAQDYVVNDIDDHLYELYSMFSTYRKDEIVSHLEKRIDEFGLARERTKRNEYKDKSKIEEYKTAYARFRKFYNEQKEKSVLDFYALMFYSFSQQFRFNNRGEFNMPCGNDCFSDKNKSYIGNGCNFFKFCDVKISKFDFRYIDIEKLTTDDYVYLDPPYYNTTATYTENSGWNERDEQDLLDLCLKLDKNGIKFGLSNIFENKGKVNHNLIEWCSSNNFNVFTFDRFTYMACGKGNSNAKEVFITNY